MGELKLLLIRKHGTKGFTHGQLFIDGMYFCDTLEDEERPVKIPGATAIRTGTYKVILNMSARFKRVMPLLLDVPNFTGIRIHNGNTAKHTDGCILAGTYLDQGYVANSRVTFASLMKRLNAAVKEGKRLEIQIR